MKVKIGFLFIFGLFLFSACSLERKLALDYFKKSHNKGAVLVVQPYSLDLINNKEYNFDSLQLAGNFNIDSAIFYRSKILKQVSDSVLLENYLNAFIKTLTQIGYQVYLPHELDSFKIATGPAYIFRFAQVELSEEKFFYVIDEEIEGIDFYKAVELNLVKLSSWFEFEARDTIWNKVFFAENSVIDELNGQFISDYQKGKPAFIYRIDSLEMPKVYQMVTNSGKLYASYFTNYLLNNHIKQGFPKGLEPQIIFHYDVEGKMLFPYNEGFQDLSTNK